MSTTEQQLKDLYSQQLAANKDRLQANYAAANAEYDAQNKANQKTLDQNLNRTAVEAQQSAINQSELHNAYGLSSGARSQARIALENQKANNMTALRQTAQEQDAELERQRAALGQQFQQAIRQAQQENEYALAEALYKEAKEKEDKYNTEKDSAAWTYAQMMAEAGDYTPVFNYLRSKGVNATHDALLGLMGQAAPSASALVPIYTPKDTASNTPSSQMMKFIEEASALEEWRNISPSYFKYKIEDLLARSDLSDAEFEFLEKYYHL